MELLTLLPLSAVWGGSFLFMRVAAPEFGPVPLVLIRITLAALCLLPFLFSSTNRRLIAHHKKDLLIIGILNSAVPFSLLSFATLSLEAGFTSLLNATTPLFTTIIAGVWLKHPVRRSQIVGLGLGFLGVSILAWDRLSFKSGGAGWAILAGLLASSCYGISSNLTKSRLSTVPSPVFAAGSLFGTALTTQIFPLQLKKTPTN